MSGGKGGGSSQTIGYDYFFGIHMGICRGPIDELVEIRVADKTAWPYPANAATNNPINDAPVIDRSARQQFAGDVSAIWANDQASGAFGVIRIYDRFITPPLEGATALKFEIYNSTRWITDYYGNYTQFNIDGIYDAVDVLEDSFAFIAPYSDQVRLFNLYGWTLGTPINGRSQLLGVQAMNQNNQYFPPDSNTSPGSPGTVARVLGSTQIYINAPELFGGHKSEGGIQGPADVMMGEPTQVASPGLRAMLGDPQPGFRGMCSIFFNGLISSLNPYPKTWLFRVRRSTKGWDGDCFMPELATIMMTRDTTPAENTSDVTIHAMNPAHIIYECLTNRAWGRGLPRSALSEASFAAAARTLYSENFGLCLRWTRSDSIESFIQSVLDHIGATIYQGAADALINIRLIRNDYDPNTLRRFDPDNGLLAVGSATVVSGGNYVNEIRVTYRDPITNEERQARVQNLGSVQANRGSVVSESKTYMGIPTPALAARVAQRDLRTKGLELRVFDVTLDRRADDLRPGDVFILRDATRNIPDTIVRVITFGDGTLTAGSIAVKCVQDMFGMPNSTYVSQEKKGWIPPTVRPCVGAHKVFELPYAILARITRPADFAYINEESGYFGVALEQGQPLNAGYEMAVRMSAPTPDDIPASTANYCGYVPPTP